jgi:hypothetical protein
VTPSPYNEDYLEATVKVEHTIARWNSDTQLAEFPDIEGSNIMYSPLKAHELCNQLNGMIRLIMGGPHPDTKYWRVVETTHIRESQFSQNSLCKSGNVHKHFIDNLHTNVTCPRCSAIKFNKPDIEIDVTN